MVCICGRDRRKGLEAVDNLPVVIRASRRVAELEGHRIAQRDLSSRRQWRKCSGHGGLGQPCEHTRVDQILDPCHLLVGTPRLTGGLEIESTLLAEQGDEFQSTPGMDDFAQSGVDRRSQGGRSEDLGRLLKDILIYFNRCLCHVVDDIAIPKIRAMEHPYNAASGRRYGGSSPAVGIGNAP